MRKQSADKLTELAKIGRLLSNGEITPQKADELIDKALGIGENEGPEVEYHTPEELERFESGNED